MDQNTQKNSLKWQNCWLGIQTVILFLTVVTAVCIGIKQNQINQNLLNVEQINIQPVLAFIAENKTPFKFMNIGKGPALNIFLIWGTDAGEIFLSSGTDTITAQAIGGETFLLREKTKPITLEQVKALIPYAYNYVSENVSKRANWLGLIYEDLDHNCFSSTIFGRGVEYYSQGMIYKKLQCQL